MDFREVVESLRIIRRYCQGKQSCEKCRLHSKEDSSLCGVSVKGVVPSTWEFDLDPEESVPSIFKK